MQLAEKLQLLRKQKNLSQEEFAEKIGVSRQAITKWESGQSNPDINNLLELSNLFQISIDRLLKSEDAACNKQIIASETNIDDEAIDFLCRAKKNTYAASMAEGSSCRPASHDLYYSEGNYTYIDTFLGGELFSGQEGLWINQLPVWAMNYSGRVLNDRFPDQFLKEALYHTPFDKPFRGPSLYQSGDYTYKNLIQGTFAWFQGYEDIYCQDIKTYELFFHGGIIR